MINIIRKNLIKEKLLPGFALKSHQKDSGQRLNLEVVERFKVMFLQVM
jgi:hypothetical protein